MNRQTAFATLFLAASAAFSSFAQDKPPEVPAGVRYEPDIVFGKGADVELALDIARPEKLDKPAPCVVFIHGGAWRGGNRKVHVPQILDFAQRGYVAVTVSYRLIPVVRFPGQVEDVKCAIRYLRANAEKHKLDPGKIGAVGFSAGGHLVMMLGVMEKSDGLEGNGGHADQSSKVNAVVAFFGPTELGADDIPARSAGLVNDFLDSTEEENPAVRKTASPITYVDKADAPLLIYQGTKDPLVPHTQAFLMADAMTKAGMSGRVELLIGAGHGWDEPEKGRTLDGTAAFFEKHLK